MYSFSLASFFVGLIIVIASGIFLAFHQKIADNFGDGISDYQNYKKWGLIACGFGAFIMFSLHSIPLNIIISLIFRG